MTSSTKGYLRWIFDYLVDHPIMSLVVYFTAVFEPFLYMVPMFISANIVDVLFNKGGWSEVYDLLLILIPLAVIQVLLFFTSSFVNEILAHRITTDITYDLFERMQGRSMAYHDSKDSGKAMTVAMNDTRSLNMFLNPGIRMVIAAITIWGVAGLVLSLIDIRLVYILGITFLLFIVFVIRYRIKVGVISTRVLEELTEISAVTSDSFTGIRDIKSYNASNKFNSKFSRKVIKQAVSMEEEGKAGSIFFPSLIVQTSIIAMITYTIYLLVIGEISFSYLVLVTTALSFVTGFSGEFKWISFVMASGIAAAKRLHHSMNEEDLHYIENGSYEFENIPASIEFKDVCFGFDLRNEDGEKEGYRKALKNISFKLEDNETLAIVGGPGSGKSTLSKLIQRLYLPTSGEILIGDIPIQNFENGSLRKGMATIEQEVFLFNDTIFENIRFGIPDATAEEVEKFAKLAQAHNFISEFNEGYDTIIGDNGVRLSGGQAQRVAIARALLINPNILIIDDGASALDSRTELQIQKAIKEILKTRTTLITTHRLAIIAQADRILILDKGEIKGFDTHENLIKSNSYYRKFFEKHYELPEIIQEVTL